MTMLLAIFLLFCVVPGFALDGVVESPRYTEPGIYQALPGWVDLEVVLSDTLPSADDGISHTPLSLPPDYRVSFRGRTYDRLSVYADGRIALGETGEHIDVGLVPYVYPVRCEGSLGSTFRYGFVTETFDDRTDFFTVVEFGRFEEAGKEYSLQVLFYSDGEIQVQLWSHFEAAVQHFLPSLANLIGGLFVVRDDWMVPILYDGFRREILSGNQMTSMEIFGTSGLRPGWVAKSFNGGGVAMSVSSSGLMASFGEYQHAGALVAYDHSREHPVVGGISSVSLDVQPRSVDDPVHLWYFEESIERTHEAGYPTLGPSVSSLRLLPSDYQDSWDRILETHSYEAVVFRPAPAFKFQLTSARTPNTSLSFGRIVYSLSQLPSVQFLPARTPEYTLSLTVEGGGYVRMDYPSGESPFAMWAGESASSRIVPLPGSELVSVTVNGEEVVSGSRLVGIGHVGLLTPLSGGDFRSGAALRIASMKENLDIRFVFAPCGGRKLAAVIPATVRTTYYLDDGSDPQSRRSANYVVKDGLGGTAEVQDSISAGHYWVQGLYADGLGKVRYSPLAFVRDTSAFGYFDKACHACVSRANLFYDGTDSVDRPDAQGVAYTENDPRYGNRAGSTGREAGLADASFLSWPDHPETWELPAVSVDDFIEESDFSDRSVEDIYRRRMLSGGGYLLSVSRDAEGRIAQAIRDYRGLVVATRTFDGTSGLVWRNGYDAAGRLVHAWPEGQAGLGSTHSYDASGRPAASESADRGLSEIRYDSLGRVRFTRSAEQLARGPRYFSAVFYDRMGRDSLTAEIRGTCSFDSSDAAIAAGDVVPVRRNLYGRPGLDFLAGLGLVDDIDLWNEVRQGLSGVRANDAVGGIAYDRDGNAVEISLSARDRLGRVTTNYLVRHVGGITIAIRKSYSYSMADELLSMSWSQWENGAFVTKGTVSYAYDSYGRPVSATETGGARVDYTYSPYGNVLTTQRSDGNMEISSYGSVHDIHGRPLSRTYTRGGAALYSETISYANPVSDRVDGVVHDYGNLQGAGNVTRVSSYTYDYRGRLALAQGPLAGAYSYDRFGRFTTKTEGESSVHYFYDADRFRPTRVSFGQGSDEYYRYDASGRMWLDRQGKTAYELNSSGLPDKVRMYSEVPGDMTIDDIGGDFIYDSETGYERYVYGLGGSRIYRSRTLRPVGLQYEESEVQGIGTWRKNRFDAYQSMLREDLPGGGFRDAATSGAVYPLVDHQGSVRAYAGTDGIVAAYDYYPYGAVSSVYLSSSPVGERRWQDKELDDATGNYYFGARFYNPLLGMWLVPDPAGQYVDPYGYGGDPVNLIDPSGLWAIGAGLVVGYDRAHGFSVGVGAAYDIGVGSSFNASYSWNSDGSYTANLSASMSVPLPGVPLWANFGGGYSYNSETGHALTGQMGACAGIGDLLCSGASVGGGLYWSNSEFLGGTAYVEAYASVGGVYGASAGKEWGYGDVTGRGWYMGINAAGAYAGVSRNGGLDWGWHTSLYYGSTDEGNTFAADNSHRRVSRMIWIPELGSLGIFKLGESVDETRLGIQKVLKRILLERAKGTQLEESLIQNYRTTEQVEQFHITADMLRQVEETLLLQQGLVKVNRGDKNKITYANNINQWGNIEFKTLDGGKTFFSSYNYGIGPIDHFFLDVIGYWMSN